MSLNPVLDWLMVWVSLFFLLKCINDGGQVLHCLSFLKLQFLLHEQTHNIPGRSLVLRK